MIDRRELASGINTLTKPPKETLLILHAVFYSSLSLLLCLSLVSTPTSRVLSPSSISLTTQMAGDVAQTTPTAPIFTFPPHNMTHISSY